MTALLLRPTSPLPPPQSAPLRRRQPHGLKVGVASTLEEVTDAWRLVYDVYVQSGLILPNQHLIHTAPQAVHANTAVIYSNIGSQVGSTLSAVIDSAAGLPLDRVYPIELELLRRKGRRLVEFGLLADNTAEMELPQGRSINITRYPRLKRLNDSLVNVIRMAYCYTLHREATDIVIGVHPKHAPFYRRAYGFEQHGPLRSYAAVNDSPAVLLRCNLLSHLQSGDLPDGLAFALDHMVHVRTFHDCFDFDPASVLGGCSPIEDFLRCQYPDWEEAA